MDRYLAEATEGIQKITTKLIKLFPTPKCQPEHFESIPNALLLYSNHCRWLDFNLQLIRVFKMNLNSKILICQLSSQLRCDDDVGIGRGKCAEFFYKMQKYWYVFIL